MSNKVFVTGGNGFLALHLIAQLLRSNHTVITSVRQLNKQSDVLDTLAKHHVPNLDQLSFVAADLTQAAGWEAAFADVDTVFSVAAPVFVNGEKTAAAMANVATEGTMNILTAAEKAGVRHVIMTANFGAVGFSSLDQNRTTTEDDWTDPDQPGLSLYERSKLLAEKAAWAFVHDDQHHLQLTTINAGAMLGPALNSHVSGSFGLVNNLLNGSTKLIPDITVAVVDVRDVAALHILAMQQPALNHRFLAVADQELSLPQMAALIREKRPQLTAAIPTKKLPNWVLNTAAHFNQTAKEGNLMRRISHQVSNQKAKDLLGWHPQYTAEEAVLAAADTLTQYGLVKAPS